MIRAIVFDTGTLGMAVRPGRYPAFADWMKKVAQSGSLLVIPEIADYEERRGYQLKDWSTQISRLDELGRTLQYLPLNTTVMRLAAELWAKARRQGRPTAPDRALDCDVILAAQALELPSTLKLPGINVVVATDNVGHLGRYVDAQRWEDVFQ